MRSSSTAPVNHSFQMLLPPIRRAPLVTLIGPLSGREPASVPLTYSLRLKPSYVPARWLQTLVANWAEPGVQVVLPPWRTETIGRRGPPLSLPLLSAYRA